MPHGIVNDQIGRAIWVTGSPGCGYSTCRHILGLKDLERIAGYRTSHALPRQWLGCEDIVRYHVTDPQRFPVYAGFFQNYRDIGAHFGAVYILKLSEAELDRRVTQYRREHSIGSGCRHNDGISTTRACLSAIDLQRRMLMWADETSNCFVVSSEGTPIEVASRLVSRIARSGRTDILRRERCGHYRFRGRKCWCRGQAISWT